MVDVNAIVLLSGGQDSTTALYWAMEKHGSVHAVSFDYGQRHKVELVQAQQIAAFAGVPHTVLAAHDLSAVADSSLTRPSVIVAPPGALPSTFVPGRNLYFLILAAAFGYQHNCLNYVIGVSAVDYSGYPDCRTQTIKMMQFALRNGMDRPINIDAPLINYSKARTVEMALENGAMDAMHLTHTCYEGRRPACGTCPACQIRLDGFRAARVADPIEYEGQA